MKKQLLLLAITIFTAVITSQAQTLAVKRQIVNKLISEDQLTQEKVREYGGINKVISVRAIDLNKGKKPEYIVDCSCETQQAIYIFRKTASGFEIIFWGSQRQSITPLNSYTNGWRNLRLESYSSVTGEVDHETLRWNGSEYR